MRRRQRSGSSATSTGASSSRRARAKLPLRPFKRSVFHPQQNEPYWRGGCDNGRAICCDQVGQFALRSSSVCASFSSSRRKPSRYPARAIRIASPAGSGNDGVARLVALRLSAAWAQPVIVDNRTGAGGTIAAEYVAKSPPDGYTLLVSTASLAVNATLFPKLPVRELVRFRHLLELDCHRCTSVCSGTYAERTARPRQVPKRGPQFRPTPGSAPKPIR